jgi:hypothetical protein
VEGGEVDINTSLLHSSPSSFSTLNVLFSIGD